jgi:hypothetical protein
MRHGKRRNPALYQALEDPREPVYNESGACRTSARHKLAAALAHIVVIVGAPRLACAYLRAHAHICILNLERSRVSMKI